jgi:hypothetical protein
MSHPICGVLNVSMNIRFRIGYSTCCRCARVDGGRIGWVDQRAVFFVLFILFFVALAGFVQAQAGEV